VSINVAKRIREVGSAEVLMIQASGLTVKVESIFTVRKERNVSRTIREK